jgi:outer membrane protein TolC
MNKLLAAVALVGLISVGGRADNPKSDQANRHSKKVRALQEERLVTLKEIAAEKEKAFRDGRAPSEDVLQAKLLVLGAELELCDSDGERVAVHESIVAVAKEIEETQASRYKAQRLSHSDLLTAKANRLEAEVAHERAKAKAAATQKRPEPSR